MQWKSVSIGEKKTSSVTLRKKNESYYLFRPGSQGPQGDYRGVGCDISVGVDDWLFFVPVFQVLTFEVREPRRTYEVIKVHEKKRKCTASITAVTSTCESRNGIASCLRHISRPSSTLRHTVFFRTIDSWARSCRSRMCGPDSSVGSSCSSSW